MAQESDEIICRECGTKWEITPLTEWGYDWQADCPECDTVHTKQQAAQQCVNADVCPRCDGTGRTRNDGFVWVACPACDGAGIRRLR